MSLNLYEVRDETTKIQLCCHEVLNRILDLMVKHPKHAAHLNKYSKACLVMERLCEYISHGCCNSVGLSSHIISERNLKCNEMINCCNSVMSCGLSKDDCKYLRCEEMKSKCDSVLGKKGKSKSKKSKKSKK